MKITSFYPQFFTRNMQKSAEYYCNTLGMSVEHKGTYRGCPCWIFGCENGNRIALVESEDEPEGFHSMHINVDNFMEALDYYLDLDYEQANEISETGSAITCVLVGPGRDKITLYYHIKNHL